MVIGPRWVSHLEEEWSDANQRAFYAEVAKSHRVVRFDRVGCGLSSRELEPRPTVESESRQLEAVIDASAARRSSSRRRAAASRPRSSPCGARTRSRRSSTSAATRPATTFPEATRSSLIQFTRMSWRLAAQMFAGLFDPHASGDEIPNYTRMQRAAAAAEAASIFLELDLNSDLRFRCRRWPCRRSCSIAAATAPCRSDAAASWRRCCRMRGSFR